MTGLGAGALAAIIIILPGPPEVGNEPQQTTPGGATTQLSPSGSTGVADLLPVPGKVVGNLTDRAGQLTCRVDRTVDLSGWKLALPVGSPGKPAEVPRPQLGAAGTGRWFGAAGEGGVAFRAPVDGVTTCGSHYPRSELREMNGGAPAAWSATSGTHRMSVVEAFTHLPAGKPRLVGAQIHDDKHDVTVFRLEGSNLYVTNANNPHFHLITSTYELGIPFEATYVVHDGQIQAYYNGALQATLSAPSLTRGVFQGRRVHPGQLLQQLTVRRQQLRRNGHLPPVALPHHIHTTRSGFWHREGIPMTIHSTGGALDSWLGVPPLAVPAINPAAPGESSSDPLLAGGDELATMRAELELIRGRAQLQRDPAWLEELSPTERAAERQAAETIRAVRRERQLAASLADGELGKREQRVENRLARIELSDRMWSRRASARRLRLLDPTSRLASLQRTHVASTAALIGVAVAGIGWTSIGVHDALVGPGGNPVVYVVEPIFSIPLLVIMGLSARAAQWGRTFPPPGREARIYALEVFLLTATIAMNTAAVLPGTGTWHNLATLLAHLLPPVLIVIAVTLQPLVAGFLAEILTDASSQLGEGGDGGSQRSRLDAQTRDTLELATRVHHAMTRGELTAWSDTGLPSITAIQRYFQCEKRRAQRVWDALRILTSTSADTASAASITASPISARRSS